MTGVPLAVIHTDLDAEETAALLLTLATFLAPDGGGANGAVADSAWGGAAGPGTAAGRVASWSPALDATPVSWSSRAPNHTLMDW